MDLSDFFPSIAKARVVAVFRTAGYPEEVCQLLASLCTNCVPDDVRRRFPQYGGVTDRWRHEGLYARPHLPQGSPTSPSLANLSAYRLDCRLTGLAHVVGGQYTRYADDLLFSGGEALARSLRRFEATVCSVVIDEGFAVNSRKKRIMRQGVRQHATGLVLNRHVNVARDKFDRLKATLHNCICQGPSGQNRAGVPDWRLYLQGQIAFVESINPDRARRLRRLFDRIQWPRD
jgi:hypothetical protein